MDTKNHKPMIIMRNPNGDQVLIQRGSYYCLLPNDQSPLPEDSLRWRGRELVNKVNYMDYEEVDPVEYKVSKISKADNSHLSDKMERFTYEPTTNYNIVFIPVNRLRQVYQTDEAINPAKVRENMKKMMDGIPLDPVEIGYDYDIHDGHHRIEAAKRLKYTHVPCKVVGTDASKVREALKQYKEVWKSEIFYIDLGGGINGTSNRLG